MGKPSGIAYQHHLELPVGLGQRRPDPLAVGELNGGGHADGPGRARAGAVPADAAKAAHAIDEREGAVAQLGGGGGLNGGLAAHPGVDGAELRRLRTGHARQQCQQQ